MNREFLAFGGPTFGGGSVVKSTLESPLNRPTIGVHLWAQLFARRVLHPLPHPLVDVLARLTNFGRAVVKQAMTTDARRRRSARSIREVPEVHGQPSAVST